MEDKIMEIIGRINNNSILEENRDVDLIESGLLDSLAFIELIEALEDAFDVEIQLTQVPGKTWRSLKAIAAMVEALVEEMEA